MEPKYVKNPLEQEFPELEVEKNARATFIENFEDYLEEAYGELDEASVWDKVKGVASGIKKTVTGKKKNDYQEIWFQQTQKGVAALETAANWTVESDSSPEVKKLNDDLKSFCADYHVVCCEDPCAEDPMQALYISKPFKEFKFALAEASQRPLNIKDRLDAYKATYEYAGLPILVCANRGKTLNVESKTALQSCPNPSSFGLPYNTGSLCVIAVVVAFPGGSSRLYVSNTALKLNEIRDNV